MTRDTALSRRLGSLLNPEIAVAPAALCYAPPRAPYFALSCVLYPALFDARRRDASRRLATRSIHGSKDTRQDAERDSTRTRRVRFDFATPFARNTLPTLPPFADSSSSRISFSPSVFLSVFIHRRMLPSLGRFRQIRARSISRSRDQVILSFAGG